jgi:hypothetical protein
MDNQCEDSDAKDDQTLSFLESSILPYTIIAEDKN